MKIGLVQMVSTAQVATNLVVADRLVREAAAQGAELEIASRPLQAIARAKAQVAGHELETARQPPDADPSGHGFDGECLQTRIQADIQFSQREIRGDASHLARIDVHPGSGGAVACGQFDSRVGVTAQARHVHAEEFGEQLSAPVPPVARVGREQAAPEHSGDTNAV